MQVEEDSMAPTLLGSDAVLVDMTRQLPNPPGIFLLDDGMGLVPKRLEHIPNSDPPAVRVISDNKVYPEYQRSAEEIRIIGRIRWVARKTCAWCLASTSGRSPSTEILWTRDESTGWSALGKTYRQDKSASAVCSSVISTVGPTVRIVARMAASFSLPPEISTRSGVRRNRARLTEMTRPFTS